MQGPTSICSPPVKKEMTPNTSPSRRKWVRPPRTEALFMSRTTSCRGAAFGDGRCSRVASTAMQRGSISMQWARRLFLKTGAAWMGAPPHPAAGHAFPPASSSGASTLGASA